MIRVSGKKSWWRVDLEGKRAKKENLQEVGLFGDLP